MCFHWAPNAAMPSAVMRSTTFAGTKTGAICGGEVVCGAWAAAWLANVSGTVTSVVQARSLAALLVRMLSSRWYPPSTHQHGGSGLRYRARRRGKVSPRGNGIQGVAGTTLRAAN